MKTSRIADWLYHAALAISVVALFFMVVLMMVVVIGRYFFNVVPAWSEEMSLLAMSYLAFLSAALIERDKEHIRISIIDLYYPKFVLRICNIVRYLVKLFFSGALCYFGFLLTINCKNRYASINVTQAFSFIPAVAAGVLMLAFLLLRAREELVDIWHSDKKGDGETC